MLDYLGGALITASPWLFNFANGGAAQWVPVLVGVTALLMSILTNYEAGLVKRIPMPVHLTIDIVSGVLLAVSPWLFDFADFVYLPHLLLGLFEIGAGLFTERTPSYYSRHDVQGETLR